MELSKNHLFIINHHLWHQGSITKINSNQLVTNNQLLMVKQFKAIMIWCINKMKIFRIDHNNLTQLIIDRLEWYSRIIFKVYSCRDSSLGLDQDQEWAKTRTLLIQICTQLKSIQDSTHTDNLLMKQIFRISICHMSTWILSMAHHNRLYRQILFKIIKS